MLIGFYREEEKEFPCKAEELENVRRGPRLWLFTVNFGKKGFIISEEMAQVD